ncbi:MAG: tetratricopeptide repeat protein [Planctomycetota bacterium]|jgi:tetratricopeptide (TPR) repeat protein
MNKTQVVILVIVTNVVSVGLLFLFLRGGGGREEQAAAVEVSKEEPEQTAQIQEEPKVTTKVKIDNILAHYDVIKSGRYRETMEAYKHAIRNEPAYMAGSTRGYTYAQLGYVDKAIKICEEKTVGYSHPVDFYALAWIYAKTGKYDKAIEVCNRTVKLHPDYANIWQILGWVYARRGENEKAIDACNKARKLEPRSALVQYGLGRIYGMMENAEQAIESYKRAIQFKTDFAEAYLFLGLVYAEVGEQQKAMDSYNDAILFDRYYLEPHFFLGIAYDESGQYKKAIEFFNKALQYYFSQETKIRVHSIGIKPDLANVYCIIGVCHLRLEDPFEASVAFMKAIEIDYSHAGAHYGMALAQFLLGDKEAALKEYEAVKALKGEEMTRALLYIIQ